MRNSDLSRRSFLQRFIAVGAVGAGAGTLLSACGGGDSSTQGAAETPTADAPAATASCSDLTGLTEQEVAMRTQLQYIEQAADPSKHCTECALYITPTDGGPCGGCQLIKGPIAPQGYCLSWAAKAT